MKNWLLREWHRLTLGRTAKVMVASYDTAGGAYVSLSGLAMLLRNAASEWKPAHVEVTVVRRAAKDLPPYGVRIVIETQS